MNNQSSRHQTLPPSGENRAATDAATEERSRTRYACPHCGSELKKWATPAESSWGQSIQYVCFNDDCSYYVRGWEWMQEKYDVTASYRHRYDPRSGETGPVPVWSQDALKTHIVEE
jgi:hypothetical protein